MGVLGFLLKESNEDNPNLNIIIENLHKVNQTDHPATIKGYSLRDIFGDMLRQDGFYFYEGSLTTPPCSEVILWHVFTKPSYISSRQLDVMRSLLAEDKCKMNQNYRNVQPLYSRPVFLRKPAPKHKYDRPRAYEGYSDGTDDNLNRVDRGHADYVKVYRDERLDDEYDRDEVRIVHNEIEDRNVHYRDIEDRAVYNDRYRPVRVVRPKEIVIPDTDSYY